MPYCLVSGGDYDEEEGEVRIFYQRYGHGSTKVLLIAGLAGTHKSWGPQVKRLTGAVDPADEEAPAADDDEGGVEACCFDNRGAGRSSVPPRKSRYTTTVMAADAMALMDHLGWRKAHVVGHSMGSMVAAKLGAAAPERVASLALLNTTGGRYQYIPKLDWGTISIFSRTSRRFVCHCIKRKFGTCRLAASIIQDHSRARDTIITTITPGTPTAEGDLSGISISDSNYSGTESGHIPRNSLHEGVSLSRRTSCWIKYYQTRNALP